VTIPIALSPTTCLLTGLHLRNPSIASEGMFEKYRQMKHAFEEAARGLRVSLDSPTKLQGEVDGHKITFAFSATDVSTTDCYVRYAQGPLKAKLLIRRRNPWLPQWRVSSITTGDETFDTLMFVKTSRPEALLPVLDHQLRRSILDLSFDGKLTVRDKTIWLKLPRPPLDVDEIIDPVLSLVDVASGLENVRKPGIPSSEISQARKKIENPKPSPNSRRKKPPRPRK